MAIEETFPPNPQTETQNERQNMSQQIKMKVGKPCKHSIRFETDDPKAPVSNVYVSRAMPGIESALPAAGNVTRKRRPGQPVMGKAMTDGVADRAP
jgi:hypothetical protein